MVAFVVHIDQDVCFGSGECAIAAPDVFEVDEDTNVARIRAGADVGSVGEATLANIERNCPSGAFTVEPLATVSSDE